MARKGRGFEQLVSLLEKCLIPEGAVITSPDFITDHTTDSLREVDVSIRMNIGSCPILIIIECRNRKRTDDVTWIEQLPQKRNDLQAAKIIAVSSSGFSQNALKKAESLGIETREISEITEDDIRDWYKVGDLAFYNRKYTILKTIFNCDSKLDNDKAEVDEKFTQGLSNKGLYAKVFIHKKNGKLVDFQDIWRHLPQDEMYKDVPPDGTRINRNCEFNYPDDDTRYQIPTKSVPVDIDKLGLEVVLWIESSSIPINKIHSYTNPDGTIMDTVEYELEIEKKKTIISFHREKKSGKISTGVRFIDSKKQKKK